MLPRTLPQWLTVHHSVMVIVGMYRNVRSKEKTFLQYYVFVTLYILWLLTKMSILSLQLLACRQLMNRWCISDIIYNIYRELPYTVAFTFQVVFDEAIGEPDAAHSLDGVWGCSAKCFSCTFNVCYKILTTICGCPYAFMWACQFACVAFMHVYCLSPSLKMCQINSVFCAKYLAACWSVCLTPLCESCGHFFSKITVKNS